MVLRFFMLAVAFLLSCTEVERGNPYDEESSTFKVPQIVYDEPVSYEGETYETVVIGEQTWMAKNLNYNASDSKCYDGNSANCNKYGRLYDWATAMALPASCNTDICASQISEKHRGICPIGWHIPSSNEWQELRDFVGGWDVVGMYLKTKNGWKNNGDFYKGTGNGTDTYGFSALPGGKGYLNVITGKYQFDDVNFSGCWWGANEDRERPSEAKVFSAAAYTRGYGSVCSGRKVELYGVRCVKG